MFSGMGFPALHFNIQYQPNIADPVSMQGVASSPWLSENVVDYSANLMILQQLDAGIGIKNLE